jgi:hypothetical protein
MYTADVLKKLHSNDAGGVIIINYPGLAKSAEQPLLSSTKECNEHNMELEL